MPRIFFIRLQYFFSILSSRERQTFFLLSLVFFLSIIGLVASAYITLTERVPKYQGNYHEGIIGQPQFINPLYALYNPTDQDLVQLVYAGLMRFDGKNLAVDLAREWSLSDDLKTYTFTLKQNVFWPDGAPFTSKDILYTIATIKNERYQSPLATLFKTVDVTAPDEYTVRFTLPRPLTPFLETLTVGILPEHIWKNISPEMVRLTDFNIQPMGLGPYRFKRLAKDKFGLIHSYTLEANTNYHLGMPYIETITFLFFQNTEKAISALNRKDIDGIHYIPPHLTNTLTRTSITNHALTLPQYTALFFNLSRNAPINNNAVRKALAYALDKQLVTTKAVGEFGTVIHAPLLPDYPGFHSTIETFEYNPTKAQELLTSAGWVRIEGETTRKDPQKNNLQLTITTLDTPEFIAAAETIQRAWEDVGVSVTLNYVNTETLQSDIIVNRNFDILLFSERIGIDPDPYPFWHSSQISKQGLNISNFNNQEADRVLEEARELSDIQKKGDKYVHFQNILIADMPAIFLYTPYYPYPVDTRIKGIMPMRIITTAGRFAGIHEWYIETKRILKLRKNINK